MKKGLLLLAAAAVAVSASAQQKAVVAEGNADAAAVAPFYCAKVKAEMATDAQRKAMKKVSTKASAKAWYNRPAGTFYRSLSSDGGAYYNPALVLPSWRDVTYGNASTDAQTYVWSYEKYDIASQGWLDLTSGEKDLTDNFIQGSGMYAPSLKAIGSNAADSSRYSLFGDYYNRTSKETTRYDGFTFYYEDPRYSFQNGTNVIDAYVSPKFFSAGAREKVPNFATYGGIITLTDADDNYWFGQNTKGWNAMTLYVEKPASQYALRGVHVLYAADAITGNTPMVAKIYACEKNADDELILGKLIGTAKGVLASNAETVGFIDMPLVVTEDGLEYEVIENIDQPIAIVFSGYENVAATGFRMMISTDCVDEGYGQHGYMTNVDAEGYPTKMYGLDKFFTTSLGITAPTIFLDVEWPIMIWNYNAEDGKYNFPAAGGSWTKTYGSTKVDAISVYSSKSSEQWTISLEDGSDVPSWLTIEPTDEMEAGEYAGTVNVKATAEALPAGEKGRVAKVKFSVPGASAVYEFTQGDVAGINDVKAADATKAQKVVENGQIYILVGDKKYNVMGAEVK